MSSNPFPEVPKADASPAELLAFVQQVQARTPQEIADNLAAIEMLFYALPDTPVAPLAPCPKQQIAQVLDQYAHTSVECGICHQPHGKPRDANAKTKLAALVTALWGRDGHPTKGTRANINVKAFDSEPLPPDQGSEVNSPGAAAAIEALRAQLGQFVMLGVLVCRDPASGAEVTLYGCTGPVPTGPLYLGPSLPMRFVGGLDLFPTNEFTPLSGAPVPFAAVSGFQNPPGACAAQRLLQYAFAHGYEPLSLAECLFAGKKIGTLIMSCPTCRAAMAQILCPKRVAEPAEGGAAAAAAQPPDPGAGASGQSEDGPPIPPENTQ